MSTHFVCLKLCVAVCVVQRPVALPDFIHQDVVELETKFIRQHGRPLGEQDVLHVAVQALPRYLEYVRLRDLDMLEVFAGRGAVTTMFRRSGYSVFAFEKQYDPTMNVLTLGGLLWLLWLVLRVKYEGLLVIAPECSHWITTCHGTSQRFGVFGCIGNESIRWVWEANLTAMHSSWLMVVAHSRCVFKLMEHPMSSSIFSYMPVQSMMQCTNPYKVFTWMGSFGNPIPKPTFLLTTLPWRTHRYLIRPKPQKKKAAGEKKGFHGSYGPKKWHALPGALKVTGKYTKSFSRSLLRAFRKAQGHWGSHR